MAEWDTLYYEIHKHWLIASYKRKHYPFEVSPDKMVEISNAISCQSYPRLRNIVTHGGVCYFVHGLMWFGDTHAPLATAHALKPGNTPFEHDDYYVGTVVTYRGMPYIVQPRSVVFYSLNTIDEHPAQEDLFA
jgi:hypothetical protein